MKQMVYNVMSAFMLILLVVMVGRHTRQLKLHESQIQILNQNNSQLIVVNEVLSKGVSDVAQSMIEKADWDKKVSEKIRELDGMIKAIYGKTNQTLSNPIY